MRLGIFGASGRMGRAVQRLALEGGHDIVFRHAEGEVAAALREANANVVVDFSHGSAFAACVEACIDANVALVSGTTGFGEAGHAALTRAATHIPILWEPNMSIGVLVLSALVREAAARLGAEFDIEIVEAHHKNKLDAPSGTALRLADAARDARPELTLTHGRHGAAEKRAAHELGMHAVRGGSVVGDHTVGFYGASERLALSHHAESRDVFASGALRAAGWLVGRAPGRYRLSDVLGL